MYTPGALADIDEHGAAGVRRGSLPRWVDGVGVGDDLGPMAKGPLTITDLVAYRAGVGPGPLGAEALELARRNRSRHPQLYSRDPSGAYDTLERRHYDERYAWSLGYATAYDYSHTRPTWFSQLVTDWMGDGRMALSTVGVGDRHELPRRHPLDHRAGRRRGRR